MAEKDIIRDFSGGFVQSLPPDKLPANFLWRGYDTAFRPFPGGQTVITRRPGWTQKLDITAANTKSILAIFQWAREDTSGVVTRRLISISSGGLLYNSTTGVTIPHSGAAFETDQQWTFAVAGGNLYATGINSAGVADRFKLYLAGATLTCADIGVAAPGPPTESTIAAGAMTGVYEFACTWYNSNTGHETSRGTSLTATTLSADNIIIVKPSSAPTEATHWNLYIRKQTLNVDYWRVVSNAIATANYTVNLSDTQINGLTIIAPDTQENNAPPTGLRDLEWHQSRMFYTDGALVYYSQPGLPEAVDAEAIELINKSDGQRIVALVSLNENTLAIFKERTIYGLIGDSPQSWELRTLVEDGGAISKHIAKGEGLYSYWSSRGPTVWDTISSPADVANDTYREVLENTGVALALSDKFNVAYDHREHRFLFFDSATYSGSTFVTEATLFAVFPWSTIHKTWESTGWQMPPDMTTIASGFDKGTGTYDVDNWVIYLGCGDGRIKVMSPDFFTDESASDSTDKLVYVVTSQATATNDLFFTAAAAPNRSTTATYPKAAVIDAATLRVWRFGVDTFTVTNTAGTTYRFRDTTGVMEGNLPSAGSVIVFDAPVAEAWTHRSINDLTKRTYQTAFADVACPVDHRYFIGFYRDQIEAPARVWHADETSDVPDIYPDIAGRAQPGGGPVITPVADTLATGTERFFNKRIARTGYQRIMKFVGYWPRARWYLKAIGCDATGRTDGW